MRFDLTNASYRVLVRASKQRLSRPTSEISAAKLLIALFEEECRASDWLATAGLSLDQFRTAFGLAEHIEILQSPVSAPGFSIGDYGISSIQQTLPRTSSQRIEASFAGKDALLVGYPTSEQSQEKESRQHEEPPTENKPIQDEWIDSNSQTEKNYSIYTNNRTEPNFHSRILFYLDEQSVNGCRVSSELESALEIILHRFARQESGKRQIHGITTIAYQGTTLSLATEHLLLAAVLDGGDVGRWLRNNGFDPTELYQRIEQINTTKEPAKEPGVSAPELFVPDNPGAAPPGSLRRDSFVNVIDEKIYRLFDAAANRGQEAIRVIEDFVRFILDDQMLTRQLKDFRHEFQDLLQSFPQEIRLSARNTEQDVGTELEGSGEYRRDSLHDVLAANFGRLQESLRSLEEFSKLLESSVSRRFEQLRYRCYTLHKTVCLTDIPSALLPSKSIKPNIDDVRLYALVDTQNGENEFTAIVKALIDGGADAVQLRDKTADDRILLDRSRILKEQITASGRSVLFVMNDRPDLAKLAKADAVHVGQDDLSVETVRRIVGSDMLIGVSTHCIEQARQAVLDRADYIGAGPVFESATKEFTAFPGLDYLRQVAAEIQMPTFAIGGITADNLDDVLATGIGRIAVGSTLLKTSDPQTAAKIMKERLIIPQEQQPQP